MGRTITDRAAALPGLAEVFREHGYEGASITQISRATGLGKGSLYNFFPSGKSEMFSAVLASIDTWFESTVFGPLDQAGDARPAIAAMFDSVTGYFQSGARVCLVGALGLGASRDPFAELIAGYFCRWIAALTKCLSKGGIPQGDALRLAEGAVAGIQGAIVLSRALNDREAFHRVVSQHRERLVDALAPFHDRPREGRAMTPGEGRIEP